MSSVEECVFVSSFAIVMNSLVLYVIDVILFCLCEKSRKLQRILFACQNS